MTTAVSDDQGDYRIYGLYAGRYYLAAIPRRSIRQSLSKSPDEMQPVATFYPGHSDLSQALPITLHAGDEMPVNLMITTERTVRVRGSVSGPVRPTVVTLESLDGLSAGGVGRVDDQNRFEVTGVSPGRYLLKSSASAEDSRESFRAGQIVDVGSDGADHLIAYMGQRVLVKATVALGDARVSPYSVNVKLVPGTVEDSAGEGFPFVSGISATARAGYAFTADLRDVNFGLYYVEVNLGVPGAEDWYIKSIQSGGRDVTDSAIMISPGTLNTDVQVSMSPDGASIDGVVADEAQQPRSHVFVVAVPEGKRRRNEVFQRRAGTDQYGIFHLRGLAPGSYRLFAFEDSEQSQDLKDEDAYHAVETLGTAVTVGEKDKKTVTLKLIPAEDD